MTGTLGARNYQVFIDAAGESGLADIDEEKMQRACEILAAVGLRVAPEEVIHVHSDIAQALFALSKARLNALTIEQLAKEGDHL